MVTAIAAVQRVCCNDLALHPLLMHSSLFLSLKQVTVCTSAGTPLAVQQKQGAFGPIEDTFADTLRLQQEAKADQKVSVS